MEESSYLLHQSFISLLLFFPLGGAAPHLHRP